MFIGHFGVAFAAKRVAPTLSLATLFIAAQLADLLWPFFLAAGIEHVEITADSNPFLRLVFVSYPYSHSLVFLIVWGLLLGLIGRSRTRTRHVFPVLLALTVSHWLLDVVTHRPDMPLYPGSRTFGLGVWNSSALTLAIEIPLYVGGVVVYAASTRAIDGLGRWLHWGFAGFLLIAYLASLYGPPPPSLLALAGSAIGGGALLIGLAWWSDSHRVPLDPSQAAPLTESQIPR